MREKETEKEGEKEKGRGILSLAREHVTMILIVMLITHA